MVVNFASVLSPVRSSQVSKQSFVVKQQNSKFGASPADDNFMPPMPIISHTLGKYTEPEL